MGSPLLLLFFFFLFLFPIHSQNNNTLPIDPIEEKALYQILDSLNPTPRPLDYTAVCEYFPSQQQAHIIELKFGFLSDSEDHNHKQTHFCSSNSTLNFTSFTYLRKILFYKCFNNTQQNPLLFTFPSSLHELVFIENPSTVFPLNPFLLHNLTSLRSLLLIRNGFEGELPSHISNLHNLEELTISGNNLSGEVPASLGMLKKLKILDLSRNLFEGCVPVEIGKLTAHIKLDLSYNRFSCEIPASFVQLKNLTYLGLHNNNLDGPVHEEFGVLKFVEEINLENNNLSGGISFSNEVGEKFKLGGNVGLCLEGKYKCSGNEGSSSLCQQLIPCEIPTRYEL